jgi:hypothetical protein
MELFKSEDLAEAVNSLSTKFSEKVRVFVFCVASDFKIFVKEIFYFQKLDVHFEDWMFPLGAFFHIRFLC